jgi:hypothetical protein
MKKGLIFSVLMSSLMLACGGIDGTMSVHEAFQLKDRKGHVSDIAPGNYEMNLNYKENKNRLIVKFDDLGGEKAVIEANTPEGFVLPENGPFSLKAAEYGQTVDLNGSMTTAESSTPEQWGRQSCQYTDYETVCSTNHQGQTTCYQRPVSRQGYQDIRYYDYTVERTLVAAFSKPEASSTVANVNGHSVATQRRVTYTGICGYRW